MTTSERRLQPPDEPEWVATSEMWAPRDRRNALPRARRGLFVAAAFVIVVAGLRAGAPILAPIALAAFITVVSLPPLRWMRSIGVPLPLAILVIVLVDAAILAVFGLILAQSALELRTVAPAYLARLEDLELQIIARFQGWGFEVTPGRYWEFVNPDRLFALATGAALRLTGIIGLTLLIVLYLVFMLAESVALPGKLRRAFGDRFSQTSRLPEMVADVQQYLTLKTLISLATGVLVGTAAAIIGVDFALFWGFLAFVLNYVPSIGSFLAAIPALFVSLLQLGPGPTAVLAIIYIAINLLLGSVVDPIIVGRRLRLSTLVVVLSLVFWGWVWGIIGMFLAVPLTAAAKIAMENSSSLRPIAVLLGPVKERRQAVLGADGTVAGSPAP